MFWSSLHCTACFDIMEQLQLQVEVVLFDQDEGSLVEMIDLFGIEDNVTGKTKMQMIKSIRKEVDSKLESDGKIARTCLERLPAYVKGTVPPLEDRAKNSCWSEEQTNGRSGKKNKSNKGRRIFWLKWRKQKRPHRYSAENIIFGTDRKIDFCVFNASDGLWF